MAAAAGKTPRAVTLVELLVAVALGMILIGVIVFVWIQSNRIFTTTVHRLETYQRLRTALDVLERDLANTQRTVNMEFYGDENDNGHFDNPTDDQLMTVGTSPAVHFRKPWDPLDPLVQLGQPEFTMEDFEDPTKIDYIYAPLILSPPPYKIGAGYTDNRFYWQDEIYVRSFVMSEGLNRPALVHYRLVRQEDGRSALRRRIWYLNDSNALVRGDPLSSPPVPGTDRTTILSHGVADLKIGFFFKETPSQGNGWWWQVGDPTVDDPAASSVYFDTNEDDPALKRGSELLKVDRRGGFRDARPAPAYEEQALSAQHIDQFEDPGNPDNPARNAVSFVYKGNARFEQSANGAPVLRTLVDTAADDSDLSIYKLRPSNKSDLAHYSNFDFRGVRSGDRFLVYGAIDDDDDFFAKEAGDNFPDRVLTVDTIFTDNSETFVAVKFQEPIDFFRLTKTWLKGESPVTILPSDLTTYPNAGPANDVNPPLDDGPGDGRTVVGSFNVRYRVGFLPAALLIRLSLDDQYNRKILPMERVIRLLQQ